MPSTVDAFIEAFEAARRQLIRDEGSNVSVRELLRRAGFDDSQRAGVSYHLNPNRHDGTRPHHVPPDVVRKLAAVLPVSEDELARAARVAAGFDVTADPADLPGSVTYMVQRFYGDETVTDDERAAVTAELLRILADEARRGTGT